MPTPPLHTAAIVAAGLGTRLGPRSAERPKGLLEVGGQSLVGRSIATLRGAGIDRVVLGTGHLAPSYDAFAAEHPGVETVHSPRYAETGSMTTLWCMRDALAGAPCLLLESDLLYEPRALSALLDDPRPDVLLASDPTGADDAVFIETDDAGVLVAMSKRAEDLHRVDAELVGIAKLSPPLLDAMCRLMEANAESNPRFDYESALVAVSPDRPVHVLRVDGLAWCEIDDAGHLAHAIADILPRVEAAAAAQG